MSWNAAIILKNGKEAKGIEVGEGGAPRETGNYLIHFYNTVDRVKALIDLGDIYMMGMNIPSKRFIEKLNQDIKKMQDSLVLIDEMAEYADYCFEEKDTIHVYTCDCKHTPVKITSLEDVMALRPESIYVFDVAKNKWFVGLGPEGNSWLNDMVGGSEIKKLVPLEEYLKKTKKYKSKKSMINTKEWQQKMTECLIPYREMVNTLGGNGTTWAKVVTPRMIVMQANKEFMEAGIQAKLSYTAKPVGQKPNLIAFIRTGEAAGKSSTPHELLVDLWQKYRMSKAYTLAVLYEKELKSKSVGGELHDSRD